MRNYKTGCHFPSYVVSYIAKQGLSSIWQSSQPYESERDYRYE